MRLFAAIAWLAAGACLLAGNPAAQSKPSTGRPAKLTVLLRDPSGAPVAHAQGWLRCEAPTRLLSLSAADMAYLATTPRHEPRSVRATSSARGVLQFVLPPGYSAGWGIVTTEKGLGALIPRMHAGGTRLTLQPMAQVSTATGTESFSLHARHTTERGTRIDLPVMHGRQVRLPQGSYEIWARSEDGWIWQRIDLMAGGRLNLAFTGDAQRLRVAPNAYVHPDGHPRTPLSLPARPGGEATITLRGAALAAPLVTHLNGTITAAHVVPGPPTREALAWPPLTDRLEPSEAFGLAKGSPQDALLLGLMPRDDGSFRVIASSHASTSSPEFRMLEFRMPARPAGDPWLLLLAEGRAPYARPWSTTPVGSTLRAPIGRELTVTVRDERQLPVADHAVEFLPESQLAAALVARTDARGVARFGPVQAPGTVRTSDPRYQNLERELDGVPRDPLALVATAGESCSGTASFDDGLNNGTIVVTLRDPNGELRPAQRTATARPGGTFSFAGLPEDRAFVLFATAQRKGKTWSARRIVRAGDRDVVLLLRNEDPQFERR